jgi:hypothetical protein
MIFVFGKSSGYQDTGFILARGQGWAKALPVIVS